MTLVGEHPFSTRGDPSRLTVRHHRLDNGLDLLLCRDPGAPVLAYQTWFRVGSRHEREGITGIAHLFEHLMFNQTETHPPGEFDRLIESVGGDTNAATWVDWTYYRDNAPATALPLLVELESDRMARLTLGDKQVESEREVVANERRYRVEDDVDGFLNEELYRLAFTQHPYHWPTIGWMRDIQAISIDDCRAFYRTYYAPNNATVVLVGDFDEASALGLIARAYGPIPRQPVPDEAIAPEPEQTEERRAEYTRPILTDRLRMGYKAPPLGHPDYLRLEVLNEILVGGLSSVLHRRLIADGEIASSVSAAPAPFRDSGLYEIAVSLLRDQRAEAAEAAIAEEIARLADRPPAPQVVETARTRLLTRLVRELRTNGGKAEALGHHQTTLGDFRHLFTLAESYRAVSAVEVSEVARRVLDPRRRTVLVARPSGEDGAEGEA
jgi:zinc protease